MKIATPTQAAVIEVEFFAAVLVARRQRDRAHRHGIRALP